MMSILNKVLALRALRLIVAIVLFLFLGVFFMPVAFLALVIWYVGDATLDKLLANPTIFFIVMLVGGVLTAAWMFLIFNVWMK